MTRLELASAQTGGPRICEIRDVFLYPVHMICAWFWPAAVDEFRRGVRLFLGRPRYAEAAGGPGQLRNDASDDGGDCDDAKKARA